MEKTFFLFIVMSCLLLPGCGFFGSYSYENIASEYAYRTNPGPPGQGAAEKTDQRDSHSPVQFPLTLSFALETALNNNPDLVQAAWRTEQSRAMLALAETAFWPKASLYTEYMQGDAPSAYFFKKIDQRMLSFGDTNFNDPGWFENFESGLKAQMNLFNGGRDYLELQMAGIDVDISQLDRAEVRNNLVAEVSRAFYDVLAARDFVRIARQSVDTVKQELRRLEIRHEGGAVLKSDILSMQVRLARARQQLLSGRNRSKLSAAALATLMGFEPSVLADGDAAFAGADYRLPDLPESCEAALERALQSRPELARVREKLVKSRYALAAARASYLPSLDLTARYYVDDPDMQYDLDRENWTAALVFNWDLFTGFSRSARISRARAELRQLLAADRKTLLKVQHDVRRACLNLGDAESRYELAEQRVQSAEESFRLVRVQYRGGAASITRYLEAELDWARARIELTAAGYDKIMARSELARAMGFWAKQETKPFFQMQPR